MQSVFMLMMSYLFLLSHHLRISLLHLQMPCLDHIRFILTILVLIQGPLLTHLVCHCPLQLWCCIHPIYFPSEMYSYTRNPHLIYNFLSYHRLSSPYYAIVSTLSSVSIPKSISETLSHPGWRQAIVEEIDALYSNDTLGSFHLTSWQVFSLGLYIESWS